MSERESRRRPAQSVADTRAVDPRVGADMLRELAERVGDRELQMTRFSFLDVTNDGRTTVRTAFEFEVQTPAPPNQQARGTTR